MNEMVFLKDCFSFKKEQINNNRNYWLTHFLHVFTQSLKIRLLSSDFEYFVFVWLNDQNVHSRGPQYYQYVDLFSLINLSHFSTQRTILPHQTMLISFGVSERYWSFQWLIFSHWFEVKTLLFSDINVSTDMIKLFCTLYSTS